MRSPRPYLLRAAIGLCAGVQIFLTSAASAEFYKYKDGSGTVVFTNKLEDVPKKYRGRVKVVWDEELEAKDPLARRRAEFDRQRAQREMRQEQLKPVEKTKPNDGKTLVITLDEETGQLIRRFE